MAENGYGLAGLGMGKVKSINQYRLTPGFGGFTPVLHVTTVCRLTCADAHYLMVRKMNLRFKHFLTMNGCVNNALMMVQRERHAHKMSFSPIF
ncbi:hypothetical protein [Escherichia coli]|uniref:hypothetical protein n=1 Tax=Escherichia coli TaxID=562 RepID=UPI003D06B5ED